MTTRTPLVPTSTITALLLLSTHAQNIPSITRTTQNLTTKVVGRSTFNPVDGSVNFDNPGTWIDVVNLNLTTNNTMTLSKSSSTAASDYFVIDCDGVRQPDESFNTTTWTPHEHVIVPFCSSLPKASTARVFKTTEAQWNSLVPANNYITFHGATGITVINAANTTTDTTTDTKEESKHSLDINDPMQLLNKKVEIQWESGKW